VNRFLSPTVILLGALWAWPASAAFINGHAYTPLADWADANGLRLVRSGRSEAVLVTNRLTRLLLAKDSRTAQVNGVNIALSFPVAVDKGVAFIAQLDADKTIRPLVFPQMPLARKIFTICLDPGHGGRDTGYRVGRFFPRSEKTYTLALALELRSQLQSAGFNVILTRDKDIYPELPVRPDIANRKGADLFVSLHFNSFPADPASVQGPETYCITPVGAASSNDSEGAGAGHGACAANRVEDKSLLLAYQVQRALVRDLGLTDRSVRRARFEVLRSAQMPAILIEAGYMSHPVEGKKIFDPAYRKQLAAAMVKGILNYQKLTAPPPAKTSSAATSKIASTRSRK